ncbi:LLM class flavin-dependent oxidoreductase [Streptomyces sp. MI02-7b]|uniref:LLM class flavin-dependent oxidoreductase n=1 Tax=Streptomyces sp. MI02-7b TaxID=462941 RepID=UPI0029ACE02C|nr:LLM class flavin-dependent oxidoreductase [Streptomyces sp. MI02-7b]MDX3075014.1 LLM class flavin-dependent oxidoreductase [Streptomyces sp. MI02-7b]
MPAPTRPLHLAAAVDGRGQDALVPAPVDLARLAERGALDFVTLDAGPACCAALAALARVAPATDRIGLVPAVCAAPAEPRHISAAVAALDRISGGRAGWMAGVAEDGSGGRAAGRRPAAGPAAARWREAGEAAAAVVRLWDDGGGEEAGATDRCAGHETLPHPDVRGAPLGAQGHPVTVVRAVAPEAVETAARHADVAIVRAADRWSAAAAGEDLRARAAACGRDPDRLLVLAEVAVDLGNAEPPARFGAEPVLVRDPRHGPTHAGGPGALADLMGAWHVDGAVDGFHIRPLSPARDLERLVNGTVPLLQHRGLLRRFHPGVTLREHLGLPRPAGRR